MVFRIICVYLPKETIEEIRYMKRLLLSSLMGLMMLGAMAQGGKFTLTGKVTGLGPMVVYIVLDTGGNEDTKIAQVVDGQLDFSHDMKQVGWLMVYSNGRSLMLPAIPGEAITVSGDIDNYTVDGSDLYKEYNEFLATALPLVAARSQFDYKQACRDQAAGKTSEQVFEQYQHLMYETSRPVADAVQDFVRKHPDHESSMMVLNFLDYAEDLDKARGLISEQVLDGRMNPYFEFPLERVTQRGASHPLIGNPAPDFNLQDIDGKELSLGSLRGKWVLLDFWSSTCANSTSQFPALKEFYAKYKDHVEVLGVDCEDDEADWKAAVSKYGLPWLNVLGCFDGPDSPVTLYHETATPAYFLIAPSGKVAMKGELGEFMYLFGILFE